MRAYLSRLALALFLACTLAGVPACSAQRGAEGGEPTNIERPAREISEEKDALDYLGEVAVVLLAVGSLGAGIILPILFLF